MQKPFIRLWFIIRESVFSGSAERRKESCYRSFRRNHYEDGEVKLNHVSQCKQRDVPVVPGITTNIETAEEAIEIAKQMVIH